MNGGSELPGLDDGIDEENSSGWGIRRSHEPRDLRRRSGSCSPGFFADVAVDQDEGVTRIPAARNSRKKHKELQTKKGKWKRVISLRLFVFLAAIFWQDRGVAIQLAADSYCDTKMWVRTSPKPFSWKGVVNLSPCSFLRSRHRIVFSAVGHAALQHPE